MHVTYFHFQGLKLEGVPCPVLNVLCILYQAMRLCTRPNSFKKRKAVLIIYKLLFTLDSSSMQLFTSVQNKFVTNNVLL